MLEERWHVCFTRRDHPTDGAYAEWLRDWDEWLDQADIVEGTPFLLSPQYDYDVELNAFFHSPTLHGGPQNTLDAYAHDLARFFTFLWRARGTRGWRDASESDHLAYKVWRTRELRRSGSTWAREVATVNSFYWWAWRKGLVESHPIPQRMRRASPSASLPRQGQTDTTPATAPHNARRDTIEWLTPLAYRRWRDVGLRGYTLEGLPDPAFRGRWAARNAVFADLITRTGLRLSEQASLTVVEIPAHAAGQEASYQRFWLPAAIAKGGSARWVYVPVGLLRELSLYREVDRPDVVGTARSRGTYDRIRRPLVIEDPTRPEVSLPGQYGSRHRVPLDRLTPQERRRVLIDTSDGLEPAIFWLTEEGLPMAVSTWKSIFAEANARCARQGVELRSHPHALRHTFAVVTLEQLQRGHLRELSGMNPAQRTHYTQVFGDPLDWVRRRLGHRSVTTTQIYLHCLAELELETRMALVPDSWDDPRYAPLAVEDDLTPPQELG